MRISASPFVFGVLFALHIGPAGSPLRGQPAGGQVVAGAATFSAGPDAFTITQTSARAIINWQDFSTGANGHVKFFQPDAASATLNRVISNLPSSLAGTLEANGQVYLINPNGILIGAGARIDAAGFLASTLDVANSQFLAGSDLHFSGNSTATVKNLGAINALGGDIFLIARQVENLGAITANGGTAGLAAGSEVLLTTGGNERLFVQAASAPGAIVNAGALSGAAAELKAAGGNAYALAINNSGVVRATGSAVRNGQVWLVASGDSAVTSSGTVKATSANETRGGEVQILGGKVTLASGSAVDVSGSQGGGTALIGGDYQGKNPDVRDASTTVVAAGATISADATVSGGGGKVIVWADDSTVFDGSISAHGGATGGDGGFAEVSGKRFLSFGGTADLTASAGRVGSLLLDPATLTLQAATPNLNGDGTTGDDATGDIASGSFAGLNSVITSGQVATLLGTANLSLAATAGITVNSAVNWNSAFGLTLTAGGALNVNAAIANAGAGGIVLNSGTTMGLAVGISSAGAITLNNAGSLTQNSGVVAAATLNLNGAGALPALGTSAPTIVLNKTGAGAATAITSGTAVAISGTTAGSLSLSSTGGITINQDLTTAGFTGLTADTGAGTFTVASGKTLATTGSQLSITAADVDLVGTINSGASKTSISTGSTRSIGLGATAVAGGLNLDGGELGRITSTGFGMATGGNITINGITPANSGNITGQAQLTANGAGSTVTFGPTDSTFHVLTVNSTTTIANNAVLNVTVGSLVLSAGTDITQTQPIEMTNSSAFAIFSGKNITLGNSANTLGTIDVNPGVGNVVIRTDAKVDIDFINHTGNLTLNAATDLSDTGQIAIIGGTILATAAGDVTLGSGATVSTTSALADPLVLVAGGNFTNNAGSAVLSASNGRWLVYSTSPAGSLESGLTAVAALSSSQPRFYQKTYAANAPATITAGNHLIYSTGTLTVTAADKTRIYGSANPSFTSVITGLISDDGVTDTISSAGLTGTPTITSPAVTTSPVSGSPYAITPTTGTLANSLGYAFSYVPGALTITKADLVLTGTRVYDGTTVFAGANLTAIGVNSETFTIGGAGAAGNLGSKNVQTAVPLATVTGLTVGAGNSGTALASNYNLVTTGSSVSVTKAPLTVSTSNVVKTYDGNTSATGTPIITAGTLFTGDVLTFGVFGPAYTFVGKDVGLGNKTVTLSGIGINDGNSGLNYTLFLAPNTTSTINPANLTLSGTRIYDGTTAFAGANLTATGVNGETFAMSGAGASGNLGSKDVQTGQPLLTLTGLTVGAGNSGLALASNYNLVTTGSSVSVTKANLVLTGTRLYDGSTIFAGANLTATGVAGETFTMGGAGDLTNLITKNVQTNQTLNSVTGLTVGAGNTGAAVSTNYNLTVANSSVSVTPKPLTIAGFASNDKIYSGTTAAVIATPGTLTGVVLGDTVNFTNTGATFDTKNVGTGKTVTLNGVTLTGSGDQFNYTYTATTTDLSDITAATLTYTANAASRLYGSANPAFSGTITGFVGGETQTTATTGSLAFTSSAIATDNIGTYPITGAGLTANNGNYVFVQAPANATALTINPAPLTITADNKSRAVGVAEPAFTASYAGFVNGQTSAVVSGLALATTAVIGSPAGSYPITPSGATAPNYSLTFVNGLLAVGQDLLTISADNKSKIYGAALPTFTATYTGLLHGDSPSVVTGLQFATTATLSSNVGTFAITPSGATAPGYTLAYVPGTLTINPASLTITAVNTSRTYGAGNPTFTGSFSGLVNGDTSAVVSGLTFGTTASQGSNVGTYPITPSNGLASNYTITNVPGTLTVNRAALTITADNKSKVYGAVLPTFTATYTGLLNGDASSVVTGLTLTSIANATSNVGTSAITPANGTASNYTITNTPGTLTITPAALTITADNKSKVYGAALPAFTATYTGLTNGDASSVVTGLTLTTPATAASNVGTSAITAANGVATNYTITNAPGTLAITPAPLTITADSKSRAAGVANPALTATYFGLVNNDTTAVVSGLSLATTALTGSPAGTYPIAASGATASNYSISLVDGILAVGQNLLTITADNKSKAYGAALPTFTASYNGFVNGDTSSIVTGLQFSTTATIGSNVGTFAITPFGATASSYVLAYVAGTLTINPAVLTYTATPTSRFFNTSDPAFGGTITGFVLGQSQSTATTGTMIFGTTAILSSPVGVYPINGSGLTANNGNYSFVQAAGNATAFTINPTSTPPPTPPPIPTTTPLTITADNKSKTYGAPLPTFTASYSGFTNGDTAALVTGLQFSTTATIGSNVGTFAITPFGATAPTTYTVAYVPGLLTINPATLTYTATPASRLVGVANPTFGGTVTGFVNGDTLTTATTGLTSFGTTATISSPAGIYPINGSGLTANNGNYTFIQAPPNATALTLGATAPAPLTITADNKTKTYGAALPTFTASYAGFVNGDNATSVTGLQFSTTATVSSNVGSYTITPFGATAPTTYALTYVPGTLTISSAALTIAANNASRIYGATNPVFAATFSGFVNGDTSSVVSGLSLATPATLASNVGSYAITPTGATAPNYAISYVPGALSVTPAPLTATAANAGKIYGAANPGFTASFSGFVNGDTASQVSGLTFTTPATTASNVGAYAIVPAGAVIPNYSLTFVPGTLTINPASLTITAANASREFGAANPAFSATFAGFVNGDTTAKASGLTFTTPATATSAVGSYAITPLGATVPNYTITFVNGALLVTAPTVPVVTTPTPVVVVGPTPIVTPELAVVVQDGRFVLIPINSPGDNTSSSPSASLDGQLTIALTAFTDVPRFSDSLHPPSAVSGAMLPDAHNFGRFEPVSSVGDAIGGGGGGLSAAQLNEPGLYRESTVNMGGYKIIYHEALADARDQAANNTSQGSSYREFLDSEHPRVDVVRATPNPDGDESANPAAGRKAKGTQ